MVRRCALVLLLLCQLSFEAEGQIRIVAPRSLVQSFKETKGKIQGSTATFGAPFYGDRVLGRLVYGESLKGKTYCEEDDYTLPPLETSQAGTENSQVRLIDIVLVRRGACSFTTKTKVAYAKGAHAVIFVDSEDSKMTSKDLQRVVVADDGYGEGIHIPSILISKQDGAQLIAAVKNGVTIVELSWDVPTNHVVDMDLWLSSASRESLTFLKSFSPKRKVLNEVVKFRPHYAVFRMPKSDPGVYNDLCSDTTGRFCAEDPDGGGLVNGKDVLNENVRQLCIHELTKVRQARRDNHPTGMAPVEYAEKFWNYVEKLIDRCPLDGATDDTRFGSKCSEKLMQEVGLDVSAVQECAINTRDEKLAKERENIAWSPRALRINGWRYTGMMDADLVTRAVCSGFIEQPAECTAILNPRDPFVPYLGDKTVRTDGVTMRTLLLVLAIAACMGFLAMFLYRRHLKTSVFTTVREEVMLEVQSQMAQYSRMQS